MLHLNVSLHMALRLLCLIHRRGFILLYRYRLVLKSRPKKNERGRHANYLGKRDRESKAEDQCVCLLSLLQEDRKLTVEKEVKFHFDVRHLCRPRNY